jgi:hypothetical protein
MYDLLIQSGLDPAVQLAFALKETEFGTTGPGRAPQRNLHNLECNHWDGGTCDGPHHLRFAAYPSYTWATWAWATLMLTRGRYVDAGNWTVEQIVPIYAPPFENDTAQYIAQVRQMVATWRGQPAPVPPATPVSEPRAQMALPDPPLAPPEPCGVAAPTHDAPRHVEPHRDADTLGTLTPRAEVTLLCRDGQPITQTSADGTTWQLVAVRGDVTYPWIDAALLHPPD